MNKDQLRWERRSRSHRFAIDGSSAAVTAACLFSLQGRSSLCHDLSRGRAWLEEGPRHFVIPTWMWGPPVQGYVTCQVEKRGVSENEILAELKALFPLGEVPEGGDVAESVVLFF